MCGNINSMKIGIIGGGYSGILAALLIKTKHPEDEILIIEKNNQLGKKIKATGNGKCNIDNLEDDIQKYNEPDFIANLVEKYDFDTQIETLQNLGIYTKVLNNGGLYPVSESANNVVSIFESQLDAADIKTYLETNVLEYKVENDKIVINADKHDFIVDKLLIATGGMSTPNLGSDGNFVEVIKKHGYSFEDFRPGLCPVKVSDHVKFLFGERVKCNVRVIVNNNEIFNEDGEVNFKKDGLSGIVMMNAASAISRRKYHGAMISLKIIHNLTVEDLMRLSHTLENPLLTLLNENLANYVYARAKVEQHLDLQDYEAEKLISMLSHIRFRFESLYDFKDSQVSIGGVLLENIDPNTMESNKEKNVYFLGETLDIDGYCGGFNMKWCLLSALAIADNIHE